MDDLWVPWPPRERWTAYEITAEWDSADDPLTFLAALSDAEWALVQRAARDEPDASGLHPSLATVEMAQEMVASVSTASGRPS